MALVPLAFDATADFSFTVPKTLLSHALAYALGGVAAGLLVRFGRSFLVWSWLHVPVLAFLTANVAATVFAADRVLALYGAHGRMIGLGTVADWVLLYFAVLLLVRTRAESAVVMGSALGASVLVLAYELVQLLGKDPFSWNIVVALRPFSTIGQPTTLAQYLTILAVGTFALALLVQELPRPLRLFLVIYSGALLAGAGATGTRSVVIGLVAGSSLLVGLTWVLHPSRRARVTSVLSGVVALVALGGLILLTPVGSRLASTVIVPPSDASDELLALEPSADTRSALYLIAFEMVLERPLLGWGPDNFAVGVPRYRAENSPYEVRQSLATSPHSWVAHAATSSGLIGLAAFISIAVGTVVLTLRTAFRPLAVIGVGMIGAFLGTGLTTISDPASDWMFWACAGAVGAVTSWPNLASSNLPTRAATRRVERMRRTGPQFLGPTSIACAAAGVLIAVAGVNALEASRLIRSAQDARLLGRSADAITLADQATRTDPGRPEYWHGLGLAYLAGSRLSEAATAFERASMLAPYDARYVGDFARVALLLDQAGERTARARAVALGDQAVRIDPNNPRANLTRAVVMQVTGNMPEAVRSVERALALDPQSGNGPLYLTASQVYLASGRTPDAIRVARQGITNLPPSGSVALRVELARALVAAGQSMDALAELDAALAIQPNNGAAQRLREEVRTSLER